MILRSIFLAVCVLVGSCAPLQGQVARNDYQEKFDESLEKLRTSIKAIRTAQFRHYFSDSELAYEYREVWEEEVEKSEAIYAEFCENATKLFENVEKPTQDLLIIMRTLSAEYYDQGQIAKCHKITKRMYKFLPNDQNVKSDLARISISVNEFDQAKELALPSMIGKFSMIERVLFDQIEKLRSNWERELELREKSANAEEPLPLAEIKVKDKGTIVIELFEDEAPETVANFISLTDAGFYDDMMFHPAFSHLLVESGGATFNEVREPGYNIKDEHEKPNRRYHFRGAVGMTTDRENPDSGAARFYILRVSTPALAETNTIFGRVISGMEVVDSLNNTMKTTEKDEQEVIEGVIPDVIETVTITRRRKHGKYEPNKITK